MHGPHGRLGNLYQPFNVRFREFRNFSFFLYTNQNRLTDTHPIPCDTGGMDEDQELLNQLMLGMSPEIRQRMQKFIANRKNHALRAWSEFNGFAS